MSLSAVSASKQHTTVKNKKPKWVTWARDSDTFKERNQLQASDRGKERESNIEQVEIQGHSMEKQCEPSCSG